MGRAHLNFKSLMDVMDAVKERIQEENITVEEIEENTNVNPELIRILLSNKNNVISDFSKILRFLNIQTTPRKYLYKPYFITDAGTQMKIKRLVEPQCSMYYDKSVDKFFKFSFKRKRNQHTETKKNILKTEMKHLIYKRIEENIKKTKKK